MSRGILLLVIVVFAETLLSQEIYVKENVVDFGNISKGSNPIRKFKVINKGDKALKITSCKGSCYCITPTCPKSEIAPGKSSEISVKYDTNRVGSISKSITIMSNDPKRNALVIKVKGSVK